MSKQTPNVDDVAPVVSLDEYRQDRYDPYGSQAVSEAEPSNTEFTGPEPGAASGNLLSALGAIMR